MHLGILLCFATGIRLGELCALRWENISLPAKELHVVGTAQRVRQTEGMTKTAIVVAAPKSRSSLRTIPLTEGMCRLLAPYYDKEAFLLTGNSNCPMEPLRMQRHFKAVLADCGMPSAKFHTLRHTFATRCIEAGVDAKCLSEILGHSRVTMTLERYVHPSLEAKRASLTRMESALKSGNPDF